jgi:hypothetical protein
MALDMFLSLEVLVSLIAWGGVAVSFYTVYTFKLRKWKWATYYFVGALAMFGVFKALEIVNLGGFELVALELKALFIVLMTLGVYQLKETANTLGA